MMQPESKYNAIPMHFLASQETVQWDRPVPLQSDQEYSYPVCYATPAKPAFVYGHTLIRGLPKAIMELRSLCESEVRNLLETAGHSDWDGEGADPVAIDTVNAALTIVWEFGLDTELPQVSADSHGNIDFDWCLDNGTMLTISVGGPLDIAISGRRSDEVRISSMELGGNGIALVHHALAWLRSMHG